jgi:hypothetical protein
MRWFESTSEEAPAEIVNAGLRKAWYCINQKNMLYVFAFTESAPDHAYRRGAQSGTRLRRFAYNLRRESNFFYFFAHNPLKSPDSDE